MVAQRVRVLENKKDQVKSAFNLFLGIMERRDDYLTDSVGYCLAGK